MFKHMLLRTDGSGLSRQAVAGATLFAKSCGASIVAFHVIPVPHPDLLEAWLHHDAQFTGHRHALFETFADLYLASVAGGAQLRQLPRECRKAVANEPCQAILEVAEQANCDLIYMASHGWKGGGVAQLLGSQTVKVLHYSQVAVLVHKAARAPRPH
jgi:nucleotide-binding universal stress UspA family protein